MREFVFLGIAFMAAVLALSGAALAQDTGGLNSKSIETMDVRIVQSGSLNVEGYIESAELVLYIPQEGVREIRVSPRSWEYGYDEFGNRVLVFRFDRPSGRIDYRVESVVEGRAKHLAEERPIGTAEGFLNETNTIVINPEISKTAYPYGKSLRGLAGIAIWLHDYIEYDSSLAGKLKSSDWVLENRRGVCAEYTGLFIALARSKGIPARYVSGFAYSDKEGGFSEHAWAEVPVVSDSGIEWVGFDPTWLEAGYLDGTHIKLGNFMEGNYSEELSYKGRGSIMWAKSRNSFEILDYSSRNITEISGFGGNYTLPGSGLVESSVKSRECLISTMTASSCTGPGGRDMLRIYDPVRYVWLCAEERLYWVFDAGKELEEGYIYTCPVMVYDQMGSHSRADIWIQGTETPEAISIGGPETVDLGKDFALEAGAPEGFAFFSSNFTGTGGKIWSLNLKRPGLYHFYLYSGGSVAKKYVNVVEKREFEIMLGNPRNVSLGGYFLLTVRVKNLLSEESSGTLRVGFSGETLEREISLQPGEEKSFRFNLTARGPAGNQRISVSVLSDSLTAYSSSIVVLEEGQKGILEIIMGMIVNFFDSIVDFFRGLFGG